VTMYSGCDLWLKPVGEDKFTGLRDGIHPVVSMLYLRYGTVLFKGEYRYLKKCISDNKILHRTLIENNRDASYMGLGSTVSSAAGYTQEKFNMAHFSIKMW